MSNIAQLKLEGLAQRVTWDFGDEALPVVDPAFEIDGRMVRLDDVLDANADDDDFCAWARQARPGDVYPAVADVRCVSGLHLLKEAHTVRCRICGAPTAQGHACTHEGDRQ